MFEAIHKLIEQYPRIIIHRHKFPDGDALGAQQGLRKILQDNYPDKEILAVGDMTPRYAFMAIPPMDEIADTAYEGALAILLDSSLSFYNISVEKKIRELGSQKNLS